MSTDKIHPDFRPLRLLSLFMFVASGFYFGYHYPRDVEIESTKPIVLRYEITPEAQKALMLRSVEGFPKCETEE